MGRSPKVGLDYFRLDCHLDTKFQLIEAEFGLKGFAVVVKLFQMIYGELGYYCEWNEDVALMFGDQTRLGLNAVSEIVTAAIKRKLFDKHMFDKYRILTSPGIQKWYFESVSRRERVEVIQEYLLIPVGNLPKSVCINSVSADINPFSESRNPHSTGQDSKEEKIMEEEEDARVREDDYLNSDWVKFIKLYEQNIGMIPTGFALEELQAFFDDFGLAVIEVAIRATARKHAFNPKKYLDTILRGWLTAGVKTVDQAEANIREHERAMQAQNQPRRGRQQNQPAPPTTGPQLKPGVNPFD